MSARSRVKTVKERPHREGLSSFERRKDERKRATDTYEHTLIVLARTKRPRNSEESTSVSYSYLRAIIIRHYLYLQ